MGEHSGAAGFGGPARTSCREPTAATSRAFVLGGPNVAGYADGPRPALARFWLAEYIDERPDGSTGYCDSVNQRRMVRIDGIVEGPPL